LDAIEEGLSPADSSAAPSLKPGMGSTGTAAR
jgi:hypothetical protein